MIEKRRVAIVVVTFNRKELLRECIEALINQNYKNRDILIIDNASTDGTYNYIFEYIDKKEVLYRNTGSNLGGAGGFNYGFKEAMKGSYDFVWAMDDDCIVHDDSLDKLLKADVKLNGQYGFLASKVLWKNNEVCKMNIQRKTLIKNVQKFEDEMQSVCMTSFVSFFTKREVIEEMGYPIKDFFIWTDDWEYTRRISRKYTSYLIASSVVTHKSNSNIGANIVTDDSNRLDRYNFLYRNDIYLYRREGFVGFLYIILRICIHILRIINSKQKGKINKIGIILKASLKGLKFNPEIEYPPKKHSEIKILQAFGEPLSNGGQENFIINLYENIDKSKIQFDFFTPYYCDNNKFDDLINQYGGKVFSLDNDFYTKKRKHYFIKELNEFLKYNHYDTIHLHSGSLFALTYGAKIAHKNKIKKIIVHSHATGINNFKYRMIKSISNRSLVKYATDYLACSEDAAIWKFPKEIVKNKDYVVIKNGIDTEKFRFNLDVRNEYRNDLKLNDNFVICSVGRFTSEKNHKFLIELFEKLIENNSNLRLLLVGNGVLENEIKALVKQKKLSEYVVFLGNRNDISSILQASDLFILSSIYEGLGIVAIEAQASGLDLICSSNIPKEVNITELFTQVDLKEDIQKWITIIEQKIKTTSYFDRAKYSSILVENGYSAKSLAENMIKIYLQEN